MQKHKRVLILGFIALLALIFAYSNHFNNPFELDDAHTITTNQSIREVTIGKFFKDARTSSNLPANQAYRPGVTTLNAIDYALWSKSPNDIPQPIWFHVSIFITFVILCLCLFFFYKKIFDLSFPKGDWNDVFALFAASLFSLHTANAETINYIIARADSFSTLMVIVAFLMFMYKPKWRTSQWYLIPVVIGFFVKEPTLMFAPLLFLFIFLFEENASLKFSEFFSSKLRKPLLYSISSLFAGIFLFWLAKKMTPPGWTPTNIDTKWYDYLQTNFFVFVHYINNFLFPKNLAVDTDWTIITNFFDDRILVGIGVIAALIFVSVKCSSKKETKPIAFGILWFFLALIPTSTLFPFAEVLNDHRPFFSYIGLSLVVSAVAALFFYKWKEDKEKNQTKIIFIGALASCLLAAHFFGVRSRNVVWSSEETLWKDATEKCPNSGRIWMNYGLPLMRKGDFQGALNCFNKAKEKWPYYPYIYINLGIVKNSLNRADAEADFLTGIQNGPMIPDAYNFYGNFLLQHNQVSKADSICTLGLNVSPNSINLLGLRNAIDGVKSTMKTQAVTVPGMLELVKQNPSWENWLNLSLAFYNAGDYNACIDAANSALKINPKSDLAYNNICAAYNLLKKWDDAVLAGQKGIQINPNNTLLVGNLKVALENKMAMKQSR